LEWAIAEVIGTTVRIEIEAVESNQSPRASAPPKLSQAQLKKQVMSHPLVQTVVEVFDGAVVAVEPSKAPPPAEDA
jgi:hypothetical protein